MHSESEEGEIVSDFEEDFTEELCNFPHVLKFIHKLHDHIRRQRRKINKLRKKLYGQVYISFAVLMISFVFDYINSFVTHTFKRDFYFTCPNLYCAYFYS